MEFTGNGFFGFNDEEHAKDSIRHMLRTEPDQRDTNEHTVENIMFLMDGKNGNQYCTFPEGLRERQEFEKIYMDMLNDVTYESLAMGRFEWEDPEVYTFTDEMVNKVFAMGRRIEEEIGSVVLAVGHLDQPGKYVHVHFLIMPYDIKGEGEEEA